MVTVIEHPVIGELSGRGDLIADLLQLRSIDDLLGVEGHETAERRERTRLLVDRIQGDEQGEYDGQQRDRPAPSTARSSSR